MTNLIAYNNDGIEIYIDDLDGKSFSTIKGYSRMSGRAVSTISERFKVVRPEAIKTAEIKTTGGNKVVRLITEEIIAEWIIKDNPTIAVQFLKLGIRKFMHTLAGYSQPQPQIAPQQPPAKALPSEYDIKLKALKSEQSVILAEIEAARQKIQELKKQHDTVRLRLAKLIASKTKQAALEYKEALAVISELEAVSKEEQDAMYARVFGVEDKQPSEL